MTKTAALRSSSVLGRNARASVCVPADIRYLSWAQSKTYIYWMFSDLTVDSNAARLSLIFLFIISTHGCVKLQASHLPTSRVHRLWTGYLKFLHLWGHTSNCITAVNLILNYGFVFSSCKAFVHQRHKRMERCTLDECLMPLFQFSAHIQRTAWKLLDILFDILGNHLLDVFDTCKRTKGEWICIYSSAFIDFDASYVLQRNIHRV